MYLLPIECTCVIPEKLFDPFLSSFTFGKRITGFVYTYVLWFFKVNPMCFQCLLFVIKTEPPGNTWSVELWQAMQKAGMDCHPRPPFPPISVPHLLHSHTLQCARYHRPRCL